MMLLTKRLLACICISISLMSSACAERNILGEEISILENDGIDQEMNKLNTLNFNPTSSTNKSQNFQSIKAEINLWQRIYSRFDIKDENNSRSKKYEKWYSARPEYIERMMDRSQKYLFYVVGEVEKRGMPSEIALLPMIESAYNPIANSRSKAVGIWQFIPSTGRLYGLKQDWWQDKRRNVVDATNAALDYLQKLHALFGTWDLALAAYNAGEGTVSRAIAKNKAKGLPADYANLKLPAETKDYVPMKLYHKNGPQMGKLVGPIHPDLAVDTYMRFAAKGIQLTIDKPTEAQIEAYYNTPEGQKYQKSEIARRVRRASTKKESEIVRLTKALEKQTGGKIVNDIKAKDE